MRFGVVVFPGSNCDHDAWYAVSHNLGQQAEFVWHDSPSLPANLDAVILPGGFSYGDYLRCGAIAKFSPVMAAVRSSPPTAAWCSASATAFRFWWKAGLLPGALVRNRGLKFVCRPTPLRVETTNSPFTSGADKRPDFASARRAWRRLLCCRRAHARSTGSRRSRGAPLSR